MIYGIYSIRDHLTGYMQPVIETSDPAALRNFAMAINRFPREKGASLMSWRPSDYDFFRLGDFDTETGMISAYPSPKLIASGLSVKEADNDV